MTLLKKIFNYIFRKKRKQQDLIMFNVERLTSLQNEIGLRLHSYKEDQAMIDIRNLISIGRNLAVLNCSNASTEKDIQFCRGKLEAFSEIKNFIDIQIERKIQEIKEGKKPVRGMFHTFKKTNFQAGSAI